MRESYRYWAFISYSHHDRHWAAWLHRRLEAYRVPRRLVGAPSATGAVPPRLYPVFRDRDELPSSADLGGVVAAALRDSRYLVVICSRHAAASRWVNEEIETFKRLGRESRVLCIKVDDADDGGCFAPALLRHYGDDGLPSGRATEPLAADPGERADGRSGAVLKLIAGMIGVGYDELHRRERRRRIIRRALAATALVALLAIALAGWRWQQAEQRAALAAQALQTQVRQLYDSGRGELLAHNEARAAVLLDEAYRLGVETPALRYLLGRAMRIVDAQQLRIATPAPIAVASLSGDGRYAFGIDDAYQLREYDLASGGLRFALPLGEMDSYWAAYSADGSLIWVDSDHVDAPHRRLRLFDAGSGALRAQYVLGDGASDVAMPPVDDRGRRVAFVAPDRSITFASLDGPVRHLAGSYSAAGFCRGDDTLLAARSDGIVERRDPASGALRARYEGLRDTPTMLASSADCRLIAAGTTSGAVRVWNAASGAVLMSGGHTRPIIELRLNDDGTRLMSLTRSAVGVWNGLSGGLIYASRFLDPFANLAMLRPDGRQLARLADGRLAILDPLSGSELYSLDGHNGAPTAFAFDHANTHLLSAGGDGELLLWRLPSRERVGIASSLPNAGGAPFAFSADGRRLFVGERDGGGSLWTWPDLRRERTLLTGRGALDAVAFSGDGRWLATASVNGAIDLGDLAGDGGTRALAPGTARVRLLSFDASGRWLGLSSSDGLVELRDLRGATPPTRFERDQLRAYAFAPRHAQIAIGAHGEVRLWDLQQRRWRWQTPLPARDIGNVGLVVFSPDGRFVLAAAQREYAYLLDAGDGRIVRQIRMPASAFFNVAAFSGDGTRIVFGDWAKCALLWRLADDRVLTLSGHTAPVRTASFSHDGARVLTAGEDGVIKIWDAGNGDLLDSFAAHDGAIEWDHARFSPDDRGIVSSGSDGSTRLWTMPDETRDADAIAAILECRAPWRVDGVALVPRAIDVAACSAASRK